MDGDKWEKYFLKQFSKDIIINIINKKQKYLRDASTEETLDFVVNNTFVVFS
jgi:hypothetical protein